MGLKDAPCTHPSPAKPSAPAPSTFALPRPRSHFPRPHSHFPRMAFGGAHEDFGLPQQQLSTMGYPRKSYPHRCSPPCAKRSRPRACARVYIIYRSPVGCSRECPRRCGEEVTPLWPRGPRRRAQGGGGRRQRWTPPCTVPRTFPAYGPVLARLRPRPCPPTAESLCAKAECTRQSPPLPVRSPRVSPPTAAPLSADGRSAERSPRDSLSTAVPPPADGRSVVRRVGEGEGKGGRPLAQCPALSPPTAEPLSAYRPAPVCLPPRPRRLNGHPASAGGRENDRMAHRRTTTPTHRTQRGNDTCTIRVPRRKGAQSVVHNL